MSFDSISESRSVQTEESITIYDQLNKTKSQATKFFTELNRHQKILSKKMVSQNDSQRRTIDKRRDKNTSPTFKQMIMASKKHLQNQDNSVQQMSRAMSRKKVRFSKGESNNRVRSNRRTSIQTKTQYNFYETIKQMAFELSESKNYYSGEVNTSLMNSKQNEGLFSGYTQKQFHDGTKFKGICQNGVIIKGELHFSNGFTYDGELFLDKFHGKGKLILPKKQVIDADWIEGQILGKATLKYPKGQIYYGDLKNFKRHGKGHLFFNDGSKYEGEFNEGELTGYGIHITTSGEKTCGYWFYGDFVGNNEQVFENIMSNATAHQNKKTQKETNNLKNSSRKSDRKEKNFFQELTFHRQTMND